MDYSFAFTWLLIAMVPLSQADEASWYRRALAEQVVPPYTRAYNVLQTQIFDPLLAINVNDLIMNQTAVAELARKLSCGASQLFTTLHTAIKSTNALDATLASKLITAVAAVSAKQAEIQSSEQRSARARAAVVQAQEQLSRSEADVRAKKKASADANAALAEANEKAENARRCRTLQLGNHNVTLQGRGFFDFIVLPFCSIFNGGGISIANDNRNRRQGELDHARKELARFQESLAANKRTEATYAAELTSEQARFNELRNSLNQLYTQQSLIADISQQIKKVASHLGSVLVPSSVFDETLKRLVDFELLIQPLNNIAQRMQSNGISELFITKLISDATVKTISASINKLTSQLSALPFNIGESKTSSC